MVFRTVRSFGSFSRIFSYSAMAFVSLPCWTYFSALASTFCLLKPKPRAILYSVFSFADCASARRFVLIVAPLGFRKRETNIPLGSGPRLYVFVLKSGLKYHIYTRFHAAIVPN